MTNRLNDFIVQNSGKPEQDRPQPPKPETPPRPTTPPPIPNREIIKDRPLPDAIEPEKDWDRE